MLVSEQRACHVAGAVHVEARDVAFRREAHIPESAHATAQDRVEQRAGQKKRCGCTVRVGVTQAANDCSSFIGHRHGPRPLELVGHAGKPRVEQRQRARVEIVRVA